MSSFLNRLAARTSPSQNRFPVVRRGYEPSAVDAFIDEIERGVEVDDHTLLNEVFAVVNQGYDRPEVHRYLASFIEGQPRRTNKLAA